MSMSMSIDTAMHMDMHMDMDMYMYMYMYMRMCTCVYCVGRCSAVNFLEIPHIGHPLTPPCGPDTGFSHEYKLWFK